MSENGTAPESQNLALLGPDAVRARIAAGADTVLVPLGSQERHGNPFTPIGLDGIIVYEMVKRACASAGVLHTPVVPFGYAPNHMGPVGDGCGAVTISAETYRRYLEDVGRSLIYQGFDKVVFVSLHDDNVYIGEEVTFSLRHRTGAFIAFYRSRDPSIIADVFDSPPKRKTSDVEASLAMSVMGDRFDQREYLARSYNTHAPEVTGEGMDKVAGMGQILSFDGSENIHAGFDDFDYTTTVDEAPPASEANAERGAKLLGNLADHLARFAAHVATMEIQATHRDWPERAR